jgi:hypothetical protein
MSPDREAEFAVYCRERLSRLGQTFALTSLVCGLLWWPIDFVVFERLPDYVVPFRTWRAVVCLVALLHLLLTRAPAIRRHDNALFILGFGVVCATMGYTSGPLGGPEGAQFHFLYVLGFGTVPLPVRFSTRIALTLGFCAAVVAGCLVPFPELRAGAHVPMAVSYYLWVSGISVTFGHMLYVIGPGRHPRRGSFGVLGMRERAHALGGALTVQARSQGGTEVECRLPLGDLAEEQGSGIPAEAS